MSSDVFVMMASNHHRDQMGTNPLWKPQSEGARSPLRHPERESAFFPIRKRDHTSCPDIVFSVVVMIITVDMRKCALCTIEVVNVSDSSPCKM